MSKPEALRETSFTLFKDQSGTTGKKTFIIFGLGRGGTTMVAGVAKQCGLDIGKQLPVNLEDNAFNANVLKQQGLDPVESIINTLKERNQQKTVWGWKFPRAIFYLEKIREHIVNPQLILVTRDPIATATREILGGTPEIKAIDTVLNVQKRNMELVKRWQVPTLMISYEKAIQHPENFISELCRFITVDRPEDTSQIIEYMKPGSYKTL